MLSGARSGDITTYTHDSFDQLIRIDFPDLTTTTYAYDGLGRRVEKNVDGVITRYVYDGEDILLEYDGANVLLARYAHGQATDQPLVQMRDLDGNGTFAPSESFFYHVDHLGSVRLITDITGVVANEYDYDAYGNFEIRIEGIDNPYTYTGREFDAESGLYYYRARYYDPLSGRFLQLDPIGFGGGDLNLYRYVGGNPVNGTDPSGTFAPLLGTLLHTAVAGCMLGGAAGGAVAALCGGDVPGAAAAGCGSGALGVGLIAGLGAADAGLGAAVGATAGAALGGFARLGGRVGGFFAGRGAATATRGIARGATVPRGHVGDAGPAGPGFSAPGVDALSQLAARADRNGLTRAGRALQKHHARPDSAFHATNQKAGTLNREGQDIVDDILTTPGSRFTPRTVRENGQDRSIVDVIAPDGRGVRFGLNLPRFDGFREPSKRSP